MANCPTMLTPGEYEMAQNDYQDDSKEIFLVKLTDSAYRAIEEFHHHANTNSFTNGERAQMQMNGNSGVIHIPTLANEEGYNFKFSVDAVEGELECVQQTAEGLDVLGPIPHRMRIHANDDVYTETRTKMAMVGETERSKGTKVIKPNKDEIGRKVRKPVATLASQHMKHNEVHDRTRAKLPGGDVKNSKTDIGRSLNKSTNAGMYHNRHSNASSSQLHVTNSTTPSGSGTNNRSNSNGKSAYGHGNSSVVSNSLPLLTPASQPSPTMTNGNVISNNRASAGQYKSPGPSTVVKESANEVKPGVSSHSTAAKAKPTRGRPPGASKGGKASSAKGNNQTDISRCKIRERVIQMLAVRPYKKLELYSRLQNEGLRDCERSVITTVLRDAALLRDNAYNLRRHIWNDVKEDWPFYSEQERQQLKRNKPQNLTPPISSDAASSGQSPPLLNSPSPPQVATDSDSNGGNSLKRLSEGSYDPVPSKKQRISHVTTKERVGNHMNPSSVNNLVHHRNALAVEKGNAEISAHSVAMQTKGGNTSKQPTQRKRKSEAPISDQQPTERVNEQKSNSSKKISGRKSKNGSESKTVSTDAKKDKQKECEKQSTDSKNDKHKKSEKQSMETKKDTQRECEKQRTDPKKDKHKKSVKPSTDTKKDIPKECEKQSENTPSTSKETTRKSKSKKDKAELNSNKNKIDVPVSSRKRTSKPEKTVPTTTNHNLEAPKHLEKQSSQYVDSNLQHQQQVAVQEAAEQHAATSHCRESNKYIEQQSGQHAQPQHHPQPQISTQETAEHSDNTNADTAEPQGFDFSSYIPITCVEQRRLYKAEFERDFEEYRQLLERVENVRRNFQMLTRQLQEMPPDSPSYEHIQQLILEEYERVNSAEELQCKQRFDYLQAKLAHITQMVNDYDKMLTSQAEAAAIEAAVLKHQQRQQQQQNAPIAPIPEVKELTSYTMNASTHKQTTQPNNSHVLPMETDRKDEVEVTQPPQITAQDIQQRKMKITKNQETRNKPTSGAQLAPQLPPQRCEQINDPTGHAKHKNVVKNSFRTVALSSGAQLAPQFSQQGREQTNDNPKSQAQHKNVAGNSSRTLAPSAEAQLSSQQAQLPPQQAQNGNANNEENDLSSSESDDSSDSSSDDSSSESSSESDSESSSDDSD